MWQWQKCTRLKKNEKISNAVDTMPRLAKVIKRSLKYGQWIKAKNLSGTLEVLRGYLVEFGEVFQKIYVLKDTKGSRWIDMAGVIWGLKEI